jgi:hypothetical protein
MRSIRNKEISMFPRLTKYLMVVGLLLLALAEQPAASAPCKVPSDAYPSIQAALNTAACATIHIAGGTFNENVIIDHNVTIRGAGQEDTILDGEDKGNVLVVICCTVTIQGVTIQHGGHGRPPYDVGGGILVMGGEVTLTVKNSTLYDNHSDFGGGGIEIIRLGPTFLPGNDVTIQNSAFINNAARIGGAIHNDNTLGTVSIYNSTFTGNDASDFGGAIVNVNGALTLHNSFLFENTATFGSGIFNQDELSVQNSTLANNQAVVDGGGIMIHRLVSPFSATATISNSIIVNNSAGNNGGGIGNNSGTMTVQNSTILDNSAGVDGGGIFNNGTVTLKHVTFEGNTPNGCTGCP